MSQQEDPRERNREERTQKLHRCSNAEDALCLKIRNWVPYGALTRLKERRNQNANYRSFVPCFESRSSFLERSIEKVTADILIVGLVQNFSHVFGQSALD